MSAIHVVVRPELPSAARSTSPFSSLLDLVVDGVNVTARARSGAGPHTLSELAQLTAALGTGRKTRGTIQFVSDGIPWELGIETDGEQCLISVFRSGPAPEIAVFERAVDTVALRRALVDALAETEPTGMDPAAITALEAARASLERPGPSYVPRRRATRACSLSSRVHNSFMLSARASFRRCRQASPTPADGSQVERADLHSLLLEGELLLASRECRVRLDQAQIFLLVERLVLLADDVMDAWQSDRPVFRRVEVDGLRLGVRRGAGDTPLALTVSRPKAAHKGKARTLPAVDAKDFVRASIDLARELVASFVANDSAQAHNLRLTALASAADALESRLRHFEADDAMTNAEPESYRMFGLPNTSSSSRGTWEHGGKMRFLPRWVATVPNIDLRATFLCGERVVVGSNRELACLERTTGNVCWRIATPPATSVATPFGVVRLHPEGKIALYDIETGEQRFASFLQPRAGGGVSGALVNAPSLPRLLVVAEGERSISALDLASGEVRWRYTSVRSAGYRMKRAGKLILVSSGDSSLSALDVQNGELVWKVRDRLPFTGDTLVDHDSAFAVGGGPIGPARLHHFDLWSGELRWTRELEERPVPYQAPLVTQQQVLMPIRDGRGVGLAAFCRETGKPLWEQAPGLVSPTTAWLVVDDTVVANSAAGTFICIDAATGELRYNHVFARHVDADQPRRLEPVLRNGALFIPQHQVHVVRPRDGELIGTVPSDLIPDLLRVDERCDVYIAEESGHLAAFGAAPKLTLVK